MRFLLFCKYKRKKDDACKVIGKFQIFSNLYNQTIEGENKTFVVKHCSMSSLFSLYDCIRCCCPCWILSSRTPGESDALITSEVRTTSNNDKQFPSHSSLRLGDGMPIAEEFSVILLDDASSEEDTTITFRATSYDYQHM